MPRSLGLQRTWVDLIEAAGGEAIFPSADVSQGTDVDRFVSAMVEAFGCLDCAHNNAGIGGGALGTPFREVAEPT